MKSVLFSFPIKLALIFSFLFDVNFILFPGLTTARFSLVFLLMFSVLFNFKISRISFKALAVVGFVFLLCFLQYLGSKETTQISRIIWFALYGIVAPMLFVQAIKDPKEFFLLITVACALQALIAIFSFINPNMKAMLYDLVIFTANFDEKQTLRAVGFSSAGGASLSLVQSFGVISSLILLHFSQYTFKERILLWVSIVLILISIFLIGRTGLIVSFLAIVIYLMSHVLSLKKGLIATCIVFLVSQVNYIVIIERSMNEVDGFDAELFTAWIENAFSLEDNATSEDLKNMQIPALAFETVFGTGLVTNLALGGNASGHDSGYVQSYYSLGLILASFFYVAYFIFLVSLSKGLKEPLLYLIIILVFIVEIKEPFIFQYTLPFFVLCSILVFKKFPRTSQYVWKSLNQNSIIT